MAKKITKVVCCECDKVVTEKDVIALNQKMFSVDVPFYYCIDCLAESLQTTVDFLREQIERYKCQGCTLF